MIAKKGGGSDLSHWKDRLGTYLHWKEVGFQSNNCLSVLYPKELQSTTEMEMQFQFQYQYQYQYTTHMLHYNSTLQAEICVYSWTHCSKRPIQFGVWSFSDWEFHELFCKANLDF
jgi:hypothetical protein